MTLPPGWRQEYVSRLATYVSGGTPSTDNEHYWGGSIPWVTAKDMRTLWLGDTKLRLTEEAVKDGAKILPAGTVLILVRGMTLLKDVPVCVITKPMSFNQDVKALCPNAGVSGEFLALSLSANKQRLLSCVSQAGHGTGVLPTELLGGVRIPLPPNREQGRIVDVVRLLDDEINLLSRLFVQKEVRHRELKRRLTSGSLRFNGHANIPWKTVSLGDILTETVRQVECVEHEIYALVSIRRGSVGLFYRGSVPGKEIKTKDLRRIHTDDFLISRRQVVHGASGLVTDEFDRMHVSSSYAVLTSRDNSRLSMNYLKYFSQTEAFYRLAHVASHGVHIEKLFFDLKDFLKRQILIPPTLIEQELIVGVLDTGATELRLLRLQVEQLRIRRRAVIRALLTGSMRVPELVSK